MRVTIHQPEHIPWLGFFNKINMADMFVILDNVQYRKNYFQNRNKIRTANGWSWITVPIKNEFGLKIKDVRIDNTNKRWHKKYWDTIYFSYKKAPFFDIYAGAFESLLKQEWMSISELNIKFLSKILEILKMNRPTVKASEMGVEGKQSALLLDICKNVGATVYVSGSYGREYLDEQSFREEGIEVVFHEYRHPIYKQLYEPFIPYMSVIDLLFNYGDKSLDIINGIGVQVMEMA